MHALGGHDGYGSGSRAEARARFRREHGVGQRVRGVLLGWERPGLAWVRIHGCDLLAAVDGDFAPGQALFFQIQQLLPDIVLKQFQGANQAVATGEGSPLAAAHEWLAARSGLEGHLRPLLDELAEIKNTEERKNVFFRELVAAGDAMRAWTGFVGHMARVNEHLARMGGAVLLFAPWLLPKARDMELLHLPARPGKAEGLAETLCGLTLAPLGRCEVRFFGRLRELRFRVLLEHPEHAHLAKTVLATELGRSLVHGLDIAKGADMSAAFLGAGPLPQGRVSPLLAYVERGGGMGPSVLDSRV